MPCSRQSSGKLSVWSASALCLFFFAVLTYVGVLLVDNAWQQYSTALEIRIAWVYAAAPIGAALSILHLIAGWSRRFAAPTVQGTA